MKCRCETGLVQNQTSFLHEGKCMRWVDLVSCFTWWSNIGRDVLANWYLVIWGTYGIDVTFGYRAAVEYIQQHWGHYSCTALKHDRYEQMICEDFRCLDTDMFALLIGCGERTYCCWGKRGNSYARTVLLILFLKPRISWVSGNIGINGVPWFANPWRKGDWRKDMRHRAMEIR